MSDSLKQALDRTTTIPVFTGTGIMVMANTVSSVDYDVYIPDAPIIYNGLTADQKMELIKEAQSVQLITEQVINTILGCNGDEA